MSSPSSVNSQWLCACIILMPFHAVQLLVPWRLAGRILSFLWSSRNNSAKYLPLAFIVHCQWCSAESADVISQSELSPFHKDLLEELNTFATGAGKD